MLKAGNFLDLENLSRTGGRGYKIEIDIERPLPTASQVLMAAGIGAVLAVIIARFAGWRWLRTCALLGGTGGALWEVGRSIRLQLREDPSGFYAEYRIIR